MLASKPSSVKRLVENSRVVFRLCALPNGAIVAARSDLPGYPETVQDYGLVWPRDAAFVCAAARRVGVHTIQEPFWRWVLKQAKSFTTSAPMKNVYFPNGETAGVVLAGARNPLAQVQWDAIGTLLWAIEDERQYVRRLSVAARGVAAGAARAIERAWTGRAFRGLSWDIWEERVADGGRGEFHAYSLAMAIRGLEAAENILGASVPRQKIITQMRRRLELAYRAKIRSFVRTQHRRPDTTADMSLLGLVWPAQQVAADDPRLVITMQKLLKRCALPAGGYRRYANDRYSGAVRNGKVVLTGAGAWPWLSAWAAIVLAEQGERPTANKEFQWLLRQSRGQVLPEQFRTDGQPSVAGLAVSHAMAIFAAARLNIL